MTLQSFLRRLVWVCMAPLLGLALVFMVIHVRETRSAVDDALDDAGAQLKLALDARLELRLRTLAALAQSPLLDGPDFGPQVHAELQAFREALQTHVLLADAGGRMLLNTRVPYGQPLPRLPVSKGRSAVEEAWRTGRPAVGDALTGPVAQLRLVPLVVPVLREGQPRATLVATLETRWFQDFLDEPVFPEGVGAALLDSTGEVLARRGLEKEAAAAGPWEGRRLIVSADQAPFTLVLQMQPGAYHLPVLKDLGFLAAAIALGVLTALLGARRAARQLQRGLSSLATGTVAPGGEELFEIGATRMRLETLDREREEYRRELQRLIDEFAQAQEGERRRIALDIHDDLQQRLAAIRLAAGRLGAEVGAAASVREQARALEDKADEAIRSTRRIINALRPQVLDDLGLAAALEDLVARFGAETGVDARFQERKLDAPDLQTATLLATSLFRVAQEALNNVAKHAQAREVIVTLAPGGAGVVELRVIDDGRGLQARAPGARASLGLLGMRERMRGVGGDLTVRPASGRGTEVIARAPLAMPVAARPAPL